MIYFNLESLVLSKYCEEEGDMIHLLFLKGFYIGVVQILDWI